MVDPEKKQIAIWRRVEYWISKVTRPQAHGSARAPTHPHPNTRARTHTHRKTYTTYCFPLQQLFRKRNSLLRYAQISSLVIQNIRKKMSLASSGVCTTFWAPWRTAVVSISFYFWTGHCKELRCKSISPERRNVTRNMFQENTGRLNGAPGMLRVTRSRVAATGM